MSGQTTKEKGDLLEEASNQLCTGIDGATIRRNAKILGKKTLTGRDVDVLIEGKFGPFEVKIAVESKNYAEPVGVEKVEAFKANLENVGGDLGVMVCPNGFMEGARNRAEFDGIQLFEVYDPALKNTNFFIPLRYVEPAIQKSQFQFRHRAVGFFSLPTDRTRWRFHVGSELLTARQLVTRAWNEGKIPQVPGTHTVDFNAMTVSDSLEPEKVQYCEVSINVIVTENYYLKLFPASFLKNALDGKENFRLPVDLYSSEEKMLENGWKKFALLEEMNKAADIENQPSSIRDLIMHTRYIIVPSGAESSWLLAPRTKSPLRRPVRTPHRHRQEPPAGTDRHLVPGDPGTAERHHSLGRDRRKGGTHPCGGSYPSPWRLKGKISCSWRGTVLPGR